MAKSKKYPGVYMVRGKKGLSYGISYTNPLTGQRVRKILKNATTEAEADELRSVEIADAKRGAVNKAYQLKAKARAVSFGAIVDEYLKWSKENKGSWQTDEHNAKPLKRLFKGKLMSDINPFIVEKYKMARTKEVAKGTKDKKISKRTVNNEIALGSQVFEKATEWNKWQGSNPFRKARFKPKKGKKPGSLTTDQVEGILDAIQHPVKRDMVLFAFNAGWRISEIRKLKKEDVDLEKGTAWIVDPKNGQSVEIELNDEALEVVVTNMERSKGEYVFCKLNGEPWKTNIHAVIKRAAENADVPLPPRKAWHILRRTWASMVLQNGGDVETLRVLGNWKGHEMPLWYADAGNREHRRKVLNQIPKLGDGKKVGATGKIVNLAAK